MVVGALAVPALLRSMVLLVEYDPSASSITSPGAALATALWSAEIEVTTFVAAWLGQAIAMGTATTIAVAAPSARILRQPKRCVMADPAFAEIG
jgi:hypothetical protein